MSFLFSFSCRLLFFLKLFLQTLTLFCTLLYFRSQGNTDTIEGDSSNSFSLSSPLFGFDESLFLAPTGDVQPTKRDEDVQPTKQDEDGQPLKGRSTRPTADIFPGTFSWEGKNYTFHGHKGGKGQQ